MNQKQIELLEQNGYEVIPDFNLIIKKNLYEPFAHVIYNQTKKEFALKIVSIEVSGTEDLKKYSSVITKHIDFVKQLNLLGDENVCN